MSKAVMQQALRLIEDEGHKADLLEAASILRAALAEQKCPCGDRPADQCPGEWEPGCDLGANEKHAKVAEQAQPVAWTVKDEGLYWTVVPLYTTPPAPQPLRDLCAAAYQVVGVAGGPVEMLDNLWAAAEGKPLPHDPGAGLPWSQPSPQPLSGLDVERLLEDVVGSLPVARKLIRAVEAEVLKRVGVQR